MIVSYVNEQYLAVILFVFLTNNRIEGNKCKNKDFMKKSIVIKIGLNYVLTWKNIDFLTTV